MADQPRNLASTPVIPYAADAPKPRNPLLHFLLIILGTIAGFAGFFIGLAMFLASDSTSTAVKMIGGTLVALVLAAVSYLIANSWLQKRAAAAAVRQDALAAAPLTRKQRIRLAIGACVFWGILIGLKLLPHFIRGLASK